jgi:hypothetical protein
MAEMKSCLILRTIPLLIAVCLVGIPAHAKYGGGSGTAEDPYRIATAADLIALGDSPQDYGNHFILTDDIDLNPNLPDRKVFDKAVIAPDKDPAMDDFQGTPYTGVFNGAGHTISHLTVKGKDYLGLFGRLAFGAEVRDLAVVDVNISGSGFYVGGVVGYNYEGTVTQSYITGSVSGGTWVVGGLVGENFNRGDVTQCYSSGGQRQLDSCGRAGGAQRW